MQRSLPTNPLHMTLVEAADAIRCGDVTAAELTKASIAAFKTKDGSLNSHISLDEDAALETAEGLDRLRNAGRLLGSLHGIPLAHKDMYYRAGKPCTAGSKIRADFIPSYTSTALQRLEAAGSVTVGMLNMAEFAQNPTGHNAHYGDCHNPWAPGYCPGGSSSGSGAAVGARFVFGALGSDTGGSIRLPAAMCGVTGIKGTQTRVSRYGAMPLSFSADNVGPLARTARDCARVLGAIAGHDPNDPTSAREPVPDYEAALDGNIRGMRIGVPTTYFFDDAADEIVVAIEKAVSLLQEGGAEIVRLPMPYMDAVSTYGSIVSRVESAAIHSEWMRGRPSDYAVHLSARIYSGMAVPAPYYVEALSRRGPILKAFSKEVFDKVDAFIAPTLRIPVPTLAETDIDRRGGVAVDSFNAISCNTRALNYLGLPSVSVPCGFDSSGLPIGLMIQGRPFAEGRVLKIGDAYQRMTDWHTRRPETAA